MRLDAPDDRGKRAGPVHRLDARYKLLFTLAFVIAVLATPIGQWRALGILGLLLALLVGSVASLHLAIIGRIGVATPVVWISHVSFRR